MKTRYRVVSLSALLVAFLATFPTGCSTQQNSVTGEPSAKNTEEAAAATGGSEGKKPQADAPPTASGVFLTRAGSPMAGARLILCSVHENRDSLRGIVRLLADVPTATADNSGRFEFQGFAPGRYSIIYLPADVKTAVPNEINVSPLDAVADSITPILRNVELGTNTPYAARSWGPFTLMKGHTFWSMGPQMQIWNATARFGKQGPFVEVRRGNVWMQQLAAGTEIKFDAWSF